VDDPSIVDGRYGYSDINPPSLDIETTYRKSDYPVSGSGTVHQHGTDYVELHGDSPLAFRFTGSTQIGLVDTTAHSGRYFWWSNRGDDSDMMLTRAFDLSDVSEATLEFWTWYDTEEDWDYAYVEISTDGGETWQALATPSGTDANPHGNNPGWGYTGSSSAPPAWVQEQVDLSPYVGNEVLVRFAYLTDEALTGMGFLLDDIAIPEIGYADDVETDAGGWEAAGFVRAQDLVSQRYLALLIGLGDEITVERLPVREDQTAQWTVPLGSEGWREAVLVLSGLAPHTTHPALYILRVDG